MRGVVAAICSLIFAAPLLAQEPVKITRLPGPNEALALAKADADTLPREICWCARYIWITSGDIDDARAISDAINRVSRSARIYRPVLIGKDKLLVARVELHKYALTDSDLQELTALWEELQFDPALSFFITKGMIRLALERELPLKGHGTVKRWMEIAGKKRLIKKREAFDITIDAENIELIRTPDPELDPDLLASLVELTGSNAPLVTDRYFLARVMATIQGKQTTYKEIFGGLYYQFAGIKRGFKKGTDEDNFLESLGIGNVAQGVTAKQVFDKIPSNQKVGVAHSRLHGRPRIVEYLPTIAAEVGQAEGLAVFTLDGFDEDIDVDENPLDNLANFKARAKECIYIRLNGMHGYALFDEQGALADEVPFNVANDRNITQPRTMRLQAAVSCIGCHEAMGQDGWHPITNDVAKLDAIGLFPFGISRLSRQEREKLRAQFTGNPERALQRSRDDFSLSVFRCTTGEGYGLWKQSKTQTDVVKLSAERIANGWRSYFYDAVGARQALLECRIRVEAKDADEEAKKAQALVKQLMEATIPPITPLHHLGDLVVQESRPIAHLVAGTPITRTDWALARPVFAERVRRAMKVMFKESK